MQDIPLAQLIQREKWRVAKAKWREKAKLHPPSVEKDTRERRHPRAKLTAEEELVVFGDYLRGDSYRVLCERYSLAVRTVTKILFYWKTRCEERFQSFHAEDSLVEEPEQEEQNGFF